MKRTPSPKGAAFCLCLALMLSGTLYGQSQAYKKFYVELEPLQFLSSGFSVVGHYALNQRTQVGFNVFNSTLGEGLNDLVWDIEGTPNLEARQSLGINLSVRYFLGTAKKHEGWVVSLPLGYETWELRDKDAGSSVDYDFIYLGPRIGYLWAPGESGFYLLAEAVAIVPVIRDEEVSLGSGLVEINPFVPFPGLGIGWRF